MIAATVHFPESDPEPWRFAAVPGIGDLFEIRDGRDGEVVAEWRVDRRLWVAVDTSGVAELHVFLADAADDVPF